MNFIDIKSAGFLGWLNVWGFEGIRDKSDSLIQALSFCGYFVVDFFDVARIGKSVDDGGFWWEFIVVEITTFNGGFGLANEAKFNDGGENGI